MTMKRLRIDLKKRVIFVGIAILSGWAASQTDTLISWAADGLRPNEKTLQPTMGRIVGIIDGDTVALFDGHKEIRVRLASVDAPEKDQPFGQAAKKTLSKLAYQCAATLYDATTDRYGRTVARVKACGRDLGEEMIDAGYAWVYEAYAKEPWKSHLERLQERAKKAKRGLWDDPSPIPPWRWRKDH